MSDRDEIIDQFDDLNNKPKESKIWVYLPVGIFLVGVIMQWSHIPGSLLVMIVGLILSLLRMIIRFFRKSRMFFEWCYFLGNLSLIFILSFSISGLHIPIKMVLFIPMIFFLIGILATGKQK